MSGQEGAARGLSAQRELWADASWRRWVLAVTCARLCATMMPFALLLAGEAALGSFAAGAWMTSVYSVGAAVAAPFRGRMMDRRRLPEAMRLPLLLLAGLCAAVAVACAVRAPLPVLLGLSLLMGVLPAGVFGAYRALLPSFLSPQKLAPAFAIDAVLIEVTWIAGPPLVGALALVHVSLTLGIISAGAVLATLASRLLPPREAPPASSPRAAGLALGPFVHGLPLLVYVAVVGAGVSWGAVDSALPPLLVQFGSRAEMWGALAALLSAASAVGGLVSASAARPASTSAAVWRSLLFLGLWGALLLPLGLTRGVVGAGGWLIAAGFFLAPLVGLLTYLLQQALPADRQAEGFSLYGACWSLGIGAGSALTAVLLEHASARAALALSGTVPLVLALVLALRVRPWLRAAASAPSPLNDARARAPGADAGASAP
ncbi:MFS transporter [Hyalangium rubrum]|uniref:MFS transporter n=1 Tax=Hyalangium rubrum TaxID=3103134 RepID=A0ABU5GXQ7_9BACT|nr:MFS transporter [Hyalangium sp. s54d21]MDY7225963.1 MFS transporter [Hyalangium sp. s54d21]